MLPIFFTSNAVNCLLQANGANPTGAVLEAGNAIDSCLADLAGGWMVAEVCKFSGLR